MSISGIAGGNANWLSSARQTNPSSASGTQDNSATLPFSLNSDTPYDEVKADLPNGMSIGLIHFGGGGFDSSALTSFEDMVEKFASQNIAGQAASQASSGQTDGAKTASDAGDGTTSGTVGLDMLHVDLPNGISYEVIHSSGGQATDSDAVVKELTDTAEQLFEAFANLSPASGAAAAYAARQGASSGSSGQVNTQT